MKIFRIRTHSALRAVLICCSLELFVARSTMATETRWWPEQKVAAKLAVVDSAEFRRLTIQHGDKAGNPMKSPYHMLAESLSGLAAQAVNEKRGDEMLWIVPKGGDGSYDEWLRRLVARTGMQQRKVSDLWALVRDYATQGIVKGYILYKAEPVARDNRKPGDHVDKSANVATVMSGLLGGILVEETLRAEAEQAGLKMLFDARSVTEKEVFEKEKDRLDRHSVLVQSPDFPHCRDLAIAHRMMVCFGQDSPTPEVYQWLEPMGTVFGWNEGNEDIGVLQMSREGHIFVAADWALNLTALSAGAPASLEKLKVRKFQRPVAPATSGGGDKSALGIMMSDGDNLQWLLTSFAKNPNYWASPERTSFPLGWGLPLGDLLQIAPDVYNYLAETQGANTSVLLHAGYYFPDEFGVARGTEVREELLRKLGNRIETVFRATGTSLLSFLVHDLHSKGARESYRILAEAIPSLDAIFAIQYDPYEGGKGDTFWVKGHANRDVPVTTACYALWNFPGKAERKGPPSGLARLIGERGNESKSKPFAEWVIVHAWSKFPNEMTKDGSSKGLPPGVLPAQRLQELVKDSASVVSAEDLVTRLRRAHTNDNASNIESSSRSQVATKVP